MLSNILICNNCAAENPLFYLNCKKCNAILRNRIVNIDLWNCLRKLIDEPSNAFLMIIQSENKNYISILLSLFSVRILLYVKMLSVYSNHVKVLHISDFIISVIIILTLVFLFSIILKLLFKFMRIETRIKDIFSLLGYSTFPLILSLIILFPLELSVFGEYLFQISPGPFEIKASLAYTFLIIEILLLIWHLILSTKALNIITNKKLISILGSVVFLFTSYFLMSIFFILNSWSIIFNGIKN